MNSLELEKYVCGIFNQKDLFDTLKKLALFDLSSDTPWLGTPVTFIYIYKSIGVVIYFVHFTYSLSKLNLAQLRRQAGVWWPMCAIAKSTIVFLFLLYIFSFLYIFFVLIGLICWIFFSFGSVLFSYGLYHKLNFIYSENVLFCLRFMR